MTESAIRHLIFRFEGVVTQASEELVLRELAGERRVVEARMRLAIRDLACEVRAGRVAWAEYCAKVAAMAGSREIGELFADRVERLFCLTAGIEKLLPEVAGRLECWLYCEGTVEELTPRLLRLRLDRFFPENRRLFSADGLRTDRPSELVPALLARTASHIDELLWIDDRSSVDAALIRAGVNAAAFVDSYRLRRNLVLRGLIR